MNWPKYANNADYADYADYVEYAGYAGYAEYAEYAGYAEYAEQLSADWAYHCPLGSIRLFFNNKYDNGSTNGDDGSGDDEDDGSGDGVRWHQSNITATTIIVSHWLADSVFADNSFAQEKKLHYHT